MNSIFAKLIASRAGKGCTLLAREMDVRPGGREHVKGRWETGVVSTSSTAEDDLQACRQGTKILVEGP
jgi:hypothetical protein